MIVNTYDDNPILIKICLNKFLITFFNDITKNVIILKNFLVLIVWLIIILHSVT